MQQWRPDLVPEPKSPISFTIGTDLWAVATTEGACGMVTVYIDDDDDDETWVAANPDSYVLNS